MANLFRNMAEYQEMFGVKEDGRRKNAILFKCFTNKEWRSFLRHNDASSSALKWVANYWPQVTNMTTLKTFGLSVLAISPSPNNVHLMNNWFYSPAYKTDGMNGICEDGTPNAIRYINIEQNRVFRMKSGKFLMSIINAHEIGQHFPPQMKTFLCEEFSRDWIAYSMSKIGDLELSTNLTFADIYGNGDYRCYEFGSCMNGRGQSDFYDEFVDATPAALVNEERKEILARCVIFNKVRDEETKAEYRLAERQYAKNGDGTLKRALVEMLVSKGLIDGYKTVGAGCGDATSFVLNDGTSLSHKKLSIYCSIDWDDVLSYQDSFKWLDMNKKRAYNKSSCNYTVCLDSTEDRLYNEDANYDEYHDTYTRNDVIEVWYNGGWVSCDEERLEDFVEIRGEYYHEDEVGECSECGEYFFSNEGYYSELLDEDFCCQDCLDDAEKRYMKKNWHYSQYDDDYFKQKEDITEYLKWDWQKEMFLPSTISRKSLVRMYLNGELAKEGDVFVGVPKNNNGYSYLQCEALWNFLSTHKND